MKIVFVCVNILSISSRWHGLFSVFSKLLCIGLVFLSPWYGLVNVFARYQVLKHPCSVLSPLSSTTQSSSFSLTDSLDKTSSCERKKQAFFAVWPVILEFPESHCFLLVCINFATQRVGKSSMQGLRLLRYCAAASGVNHRVCFVHRLRCRTRVTGWSMDC